ncbi:MAG TPA: hypothetical protein DDX29_08395 [Clostridiales bacterium]|nr:hypothetical protein [Clostridiales bacterium]
MDYQFLISKSDYQLFLEAPMHLWAYKHDQIQKQPTEFDIHVMNQGYEVEELARDYLKEFVVNSENGEKVEFQRTFSDKEYIARTDALVHKPESDSFDLYEIKSSTSLKPEHIIDAAFQFLIVNKEIKIDRVFINHLNKDYVRVGNLNLENLFISEDVTDKVQEILMDIDIKREEALAVAQLANNESIQHCYKPKDCPCPDLCHPVLIEYSIYDIPRISEKKKIQLLDQGIVDIKDVPSTFSLNDKQRKIVEVAKAGKPFIDPKAIKREFEHFEYPLYFLDYETFLSAIPLFDGYHPQQQMVFQYSLHKMESLDREVTHAEHLSITKDDPSKSLVESLIREIGDSGTVFVWNKAFEIGRNKELSEIYPEYADFFNNLNGRIYDLGDFINYGMYIHPGFKGSWSIKNVLPVMVPELSYSDMEIGKGDQAMMAWWRLINDESLTDEVEKAKKALLKYCELDTWAMVRILQELNKLIQL